MLRNYLTIALRNLIRHKLYSAINIVGLSIGIAFCILGLLYVLHELSHDRFHEKGEHIYLAYRDRESSGGRKPVGATPPVLASALLINIRAVERAVRVHGWGLERTIVSRGAATHHMHLLMVDPAFLSVFTFPQVAGELEGALDDPGSVVITRRLAALYFGSEDPIGQALGVYLGREARDFTVAAVTEVPASSSLKFDLLLSHALREENQNWGSNHVYTFVLLPVGVRPEDLEDRFVTFFDQHFAEDRAAGKEYWGGPGQRLRLLPLQDLYLNTTLRPFITVQSSPVYVYVLSGLGVAVLLIACINFTNLSLGLASTRLREVGVRRVLGALRPHLARQFWAEAVLLSGLSLCLAVGLAELLLPVFCDLVQRQLTMDYGLVWPALVALGLLVGLVTGAYPALVLSAFRPVEALQGSRGLGGTSWAGRTLVMAQFSLSIALITATLVMGRQLSFLHGMDLGFRAEQVVVIDARRGVDSEMRLRLIDRYRHLAAQSPRVLGVTATNMTFGATSVWGIIWSDEEAGQELRLDTYTVDYGYPETLDIRLLAGRDFSPAFPADQEQAILVNESLVRYFGWEEALGKEIPHSERHNFLRGRIVGVLADSHIQPLRHELEPALFRLREGNAALYHILVRISPAGMRETVAELQRTWALAAPNRPFSYTFMDQDVARTFRDDERWTRMARYCAAFATFLACLGAFGLTSLAVARRTKEVGIRKALGATTADLAALLSREFAWLVVAGCLIAWPIALSLMQHWLADFAYRVELGAGPFLVAGGLTLAVVLVTVGSQTVRTARANPVDALRYE